jgi:uncharacterized linocin/CFP29 family protein
MIPHTPRVWGTIHKGADECFSSTSLSRKKSFSGNFPESPGKSSLFYGQVIAVGPEEEDFHRHLSDRYKNPLPSIFLSSDLMESGR